ncbi:MAG: hypothetical protein GFH27_549361n46 [Chloroflexi bacterium AL-W]|nr:hypothetical protein [Chloroflexi bacterium AL-N1]NOK70758.1 hypothetical protein [Chloroflexi bacterium AL-N10]NOK78318.1 hypothetical protein [Chloroflexi bacterium AL-N5]NOK85661.1 hypothetical protein [Chloroflexi bacterium AL-W]NOK92575.1 hypothetical protein [Chloroflexi bacterium AL-N15]
MSPVLLLIIVLAACSGQTANQELSESDSASESANAEANTIPTDEGDTENNGNATAPEDVAEATISACDGLRLFEHELLVGEPVCVPEDPQRVVHIPPASFFYALDFKPVASSFLERETRHLPAAIADWVLTDIEEVDYGAPNLEQLAALDLDLIIHDVSRVEEVTEQLNTIAPTVLFAADYGSPDLLRDRLLFNAEVLGREAEATEPLEVYDQRVTELQTALQESLGDMSAIEVSMLRARDEQTFDLYPRNRPQAAILDTLGFGRPAAIDYDRAELAEQYGTNNFLRISKEQLEFADGDVLIIILAPSSGEGGVPAEEALAESIQNDPLWNALNAFERDNVHFVSYPWLLSDNIIFAHAVLDGLADIFNVEISTPNPLSSS